ADAEVERILRALGLGVEANADGWTVTAPTRRFDLAIEEDLVEEVARIHGYEAIPTTLPGGATRLAAPTETRVPEHDLRRQLAAVASREAITHALGDTRLLDAWQARAGAGALANPLSAELGVMRTRLLPGLVDALGRNAARQQARVRLFEIGKVFEGHESGIRDPESKGPAPAPVETPRIAAVACGDVADAQWDVASRPVDFHDLKGDLDSLAALSGARLEYRPSQAPWGHPGRSPDVFRGGVAAGWIGQLHPRLQRALDLDHPVVAFEVDLAPLRERAVPRAKA